MIDPGRTGRPAAELKGSTRLTADRRDTRPAKKSETLEVRVSHPLKTAFADDCRRRGVTVSNAIRDLMEARLARAGRRPWLDRSRIETMTHVFTRRPRAAAGSGLAALAALSLGLAAPSAANDGRAVFDGLDADHDGFVARAEFVAGVLVEDHTFTVPSVGGAVAQPISRGRLTSAAHVEFERYDRNEDNRLSFAEFSGRYQSRMRAAYVWLDANRDNQLSLEELSVSFGAAGAVTASALIGELDQDGDGRLTYAEFTAGT